ncbi:MAG: hypothetical protein R2709_08025 [Marmoricola sp.]
MIAGTIGTLLLAAQRRTEPPKGSDHDAGEKRQPMPWGSLAPIAIGAIAYGALFGALEVGAVSFADHAGHKAGSGILLALFSFGSLLAGVVTGMAQSSPFTRSRRGMWTLACGTLALPFVTNLWVMGLVLVFIGLALAPTLIALFSLVEATTPQRRLNEATRRDPDWSQRWRGSRLGWRAFWPMTSAATCRSWCALCLPSSPQVPASSFATKSGLDKLRAWQWR